MSENVIEESGGIYSSILSPEIDPEQRERNVKEAKFLAFYAHLLVLGENQNMVMDPSKGITTISIPAFFRDIWVQENSQNRPNPINSVALGILPTFSRKSVYGDEVEVSVNNDGLTNVINVSNNELEAARRGHSVGFVVAKNLTLLDPIPRDTFFAIRGYGYYDYQPTVTRIELTERLVSDVARDFNERSVGEVKDIAEMRLRHGYIDFLDYLMDVNETISSRVDTIFSVD